VDEDVSALPPWPVDPNGGPDMKQWAPLLNVCVRIKEYSLLRCSPVHAAVSCGSKRALSALLSVGCDVNVCDSEGGTPLMSALRYLHICINVCTCVCFHMNVCEFVLRPQCGLMEDAYWLLCYS
jgi:hypothetical protein